MLFCLLARSLGYSSNDNLTDILILCLILISNNDKVWIILINKSMKEQLGYIPPVNIEQERHEPILNEDDRKVLEFGLHELENLLSKKETKELPSTIVLMDISARPLYYAIKPIIENVYRDKKERPQYYFLSAVRDAEIVKLNTYEDEKDLEEITEGVYEEKIEKFGLSMKKVGERTVQKPRIKVRDNIDYEGLRKSFKDRFTKILNNSPAGNLLIIDDYLSKGETVNKIEETASEILPSGRKLDFFVFFDSNSNSVDGYININVHPGISENELCHGNLSKELMNFNAFSFTNKYDSPWLTQTKSKYTKEEIVGVRKNIEPHETVVPNEKIDIDGKKQLRKEMETMAKKVLADKHFNKEKEINDLKNYFDF